MLESFNINYLNQVEYFLQKYLVVSLSLLEREREI